ncbi:zinc dependent phospholipase C family protein [Cellulosilyticum lentocellum]|uniref:Phospholipase C/D domain-containing protein n=1 Tax=Cellulosilyticum lentocellum (strain ATCC 49066 / DSM 5427 / NCIMB 11756 / RHM5) TaxID=642492 RepID=F2JH29_CELLD|nr:zinc dependent phospholipase C family protein [Cellulosilyticum lentocellum]ADZ85369.1 hypothetical protein Clole_3686 [Cellulosilyticum lentocellum DSM 5427]
MPDIITHYIFGLDTAHNIKQSPLYKVLKENKDLFLVGLQGPDPIYYHRLKQKDSKAYIATKMHAEKTGDFLVSALCYMKKFEVDSKEFNECLSYLSGFICHYILDSMAHPYIFHLGGRYIEDMPETSKYKGVHKKLEVAIDTILCEEKFNMKSSKFKVHKHILKDLHIPDSITGLFDDTLFLLYGINNGGQTFKEAYKDTRTYYKLTYDRIGAKKALVNMASPVTPKGLSPFLATFSYYNCVNPLYDYMNRSKKVWLHPVTGNVYTFSFYDILRNANKKSTLLLLAAYDFATSKISADDFRLYLPNISYLTGLSTEDTRPMKYISPDYSRI